MKTSTSAFTKRAVIWRIVSWVARTTNMDVMPRAVLSKSTINICTAFYNNCNLSDNYEKHYASLDKTYENHLIHNQLLTVVGIITLSVFLALSNNVLVLARIRSSRLLTDFTIVTPMSTSSNFFGITQKLTMFIRWVVSAPHFWQTFTFCSHVLKTRFAFI